MKVKRFSRIGSIIPILLTLFCLVVVFSCNKNGGTTEAGKGKISRSVTPAHSAFVGWATSGFKTYSLKIDGGGNYIIADLPYANYTSQAYPKGGYARPSSNSIDVNASDKSQGSINLSSISTDGTTRCMLDGTAYTLYKPLTAANYGANVFGIQSQTDIGSVHDRNKTS